MHQSLLSGKRFVIQNSGESIPLRESQDEDSRSVALTESNAILSIDSCENDRCEVSAMGSKGWISSISLWGVYEGERIE